jgi:histidine ammonia-lyase
MGQGGRTPCNALFTVHRRPMTERCTPPTAGNEDRRPTHVDRPVALGRGGLGLADFVAVCQGAHLVVDDGVWDDIRAAEQALEHQLATGATVYGVTTGYGAASGRPIPAPARAEFQLATVRSHACGTGAPLSWSLARGVWLAKMLSISTGLTGAGATLVQTMVALLNAGFGPTVPRTGSLGASGDLIPSGHAALALLGEGDVLRWDEVTVTAAEALVAAGVPAVVPGSRDGLSLVNGTAVTTSLTVHACREVAHLLWVTELVAAASLEAFGGHPEAFAPTITSARAHPGAVAAAAGVRRGLDGVDPARLARQGMHDPYAWRCLPQVHGAARSACEWASSTCETELHSCTDNPLVAADGTIVSGGNFHGAPLGLVADALHLAVGEVAALSRQRTAHLAAWLSREPSGRAQVEGIGLTMVVTTATASLLEISSTGTGTGHWLPVDTAEDHVPNSTIAALHTLEVLEHARAVVAAEVIATTVVLQHSGLAPSSTAARCLTDLVAEVVDDLRLDRPLAGALADLRLRLAEPISLPPRVSDACRG